MNKNNISEIREEAKNSAIKQIMKELKKEGDFYSLRRLEKLVKRGAI